MSSKAAAGLLTAEEFSLLPDPRHGGKMELVRGEVVVHMPVGGVHARVALATGQALRMFAQSHQLGDVGVEAGFVVSRAPDTVLAPDVAFVANARLPEGFIEGVSTLAVEITSPGDLDREITEKVDAYLAAGADRVWVVRPQRRTVTVYRSDRTARILQFGEALNSDDAGFSVEGFVLPLDELFE